MRLLLPLLLLLAALPAAAHPAWGIVVAPGGEVYFSDLETVWKIDRGGRLSVARAATGEHVHDLAMDARGNFIAPAVWKDRAGNVYWVELDNNVRRETKIFKRTPAGRTQVFAGGAYGFADGTGAQAQFRSIVGIAFGPDQSMYVTDSGAVRKITPAGVVTTIASGLDVVDSHVAQPLSFGGLFGIAVSPSRDVYVADLKNRRVVKLPENGKLTTVARAEPPWTPAGVAVAPNGDVYVLEVGFHAPGTWIKPRVRRIAKSGAVATVAQVRGAP